MQISVIRKLKCPACGHYPPQVHVFEERTPGIVVDGVVSCRGCGAWFTVQDRLLELVPIELVDWEARKSFCLKYSEKISRLSLKDDPAAPPDRTGFGEQIKQHDHFNHWAEQSHQTYTDYSSTPFWKAVDRMTFEDWRPRIGPDGWLLDVGCAEGRSTYHVIDLPGQVVGFDISGKLVRQIINRADRDGHSARASFFVADAANFPFQDAVFDHVLVYGVLHHIPEPPRALREIDRVLKPGGIYFGLENNTSIFRGVFDWLMKFRPLWIEEAGEEPLISERMFRSWAKPTRLSLEIKTGVFLPPHLFNWIGVDASRRFLKISDALFGAVPYVKDQGGLIWVLGLKT